MKKCEYTEPEVEIVIFGDEVVTLSGWDCDIVGSGGGIDECDEEDWGGT